MRVAPAAAATLLLLLLLTWLSLRSVNSGAETFDRALGELDDVAMLESTLHRDVLAARSGILRNYDPLVRELDALSDSLARLRRTAAIDAETTAAIDRLAASAAQQEDLVEQFKSDNALLQNSLAYFGVFSVRLANVEPNATLVAAVSGVAAAVLQLTLGTSATAASEVESRLDELARLPSVPESADSVQALVAHGRLLRSLLPATDGVLRALFALPSERLQETVRTLVLTRQAASRATAREFRVLLYGTSLLLLGVLIYLGLRLRERARALQRRAALEHVIAGISTRLINARPDENGAHVETALAELAERVGADRAYFVVACTPAWVRTWSRSGIACPRAWPEQALALAARMGSAQDGIILVPRVDRLPAGADRDRLAAEGLSGWACVRGSDGVSRILGFDALQSRIVGKPAEIGLLRVALDAIANAIGRDRVEQERARLETRLQQARRMETVGALTSGIAHNFNNILGAILGHAEMAEGQLEPNSRPARNLEAIRRAAERARDLVDQILAFGRRRDAPRRPISAEVLLAEVASLLHGSLPARIELVVGAAPQAAIVSGDPAQLQQVILNLCNNAAQAMDDAGRVEIAADVHDIAQARHLTHGELGPGRYVRLAVSDAGRGMDKPTLERIFEPFFTTRSTGNGLGLATIRETVREHGGAMNVWTAPGVGSRFEAWLPCVAAIDAASGEAAPTLPLGHGETLLVVDDDRARLLRDEEMLAALGYEPVGFRHPFEALAACRQAPERFDAAVVGYLAPESADAPALGLAAALNAAAPDLPIVLVTASADEIGAGALLAAGVFEAVRRPLVSTEIAGALRRGLALPRTRAARYRRNAIPQL